MIILDQLEHGFIWIEDTHDFNQVPEGSTKTLIELIKEDIIANDNKTGWAKYRKVLLDLNEITKDEHDNWSVQVSP